MFEDPSDSESIPFTATLLTGSTPLANYTVFSGIEEEGRLVTDQNGLVSFNLEHNETQELTVPYGTKLIVSESSEDFIAEITTEKDVSDEDSIENCFTLTVTQDDSIIFMNQKSRFHVILKKIGVDSITQNVIDEGLGGATFTIYNDRNRADIATGEVEIDGVSTTKQLLNLTSSNENGVFFDGMLSAGTYYLHEVEAPSGYNRMAYDIRLTVKTDGSASLYLLTNNMTYNFSPIDNICNIEVKNFCGYALPSTGSTGTRHYYLIGSLLMILAGAGFMIKRRIDG